MRIRLQEIRDRMHHLSENLGDEEIDHGEADDLVAEMLDLLGEKFVAKCYRKARKEYWYA